MGAKVRKNERKAKGRNKHFLNFCSQIITFSIFLIIFVHRTPNVGQRVAKNDMGIQRYNRLKAAIKKVQKMYTEIDVNLCNYNGKRDK